MKIRQIVQFLILSTLLFLVASCASDTVAGGETGNQAFMGITVFKSDGVTPAAGATVKLFTPGDTSKTPLDQRELDENGQLDPKDLTLSPNSPFHNLLIELDSTEALYYDSLFITAENYSYLKDDTLAPVGSISGIVAIQPNHTPIAVLVHALGTDIYTKADGETGEFTMGGLAEGHYNLMFTCSYDEYDVELFDTLAVSGRVTTIPDTIEIPFLGIPVVKEISSSYDTLSATATVTWNKTAYSQFSAYEIYRTTDLTSWPETPLAVVTDTVYRDIHTAFGADSVYYRVGVRNLSGVSGLQYGKTAVLPVSPETATTSFSSSLYHLKKEKEVTACSINDSLKVTFQFSNPSRKFTNLEVGNGLILKSFAEPVSSYSDSLFMFIAVDTVVKVVATDDHGKEWNESISIQVVEDKPVIVSVDSTVSLNVLDTIRAVVSDEYGEIVKYEWDLDGDGVFETETEVPEVEVLVDSIVMNQAFGIRVTDDDNGVETINTKITTHFTWVKDDLYLPAEIEHIIYVTSNEYGIYLVDGKRNIWYSDDNMNTWERSAEVFPASQGQLINIVPFNGALFAVNVIYQASNNTNVVELWKSINTNFNSDWERVYSRDNVILHDCGLFQDVIFLFSYKNRLYTNCYNFDESTILWWGYGCRKLSYTENGIDWINTDHAMASMTGAVCTSFPIITDAAVLLLTNDEIPGALMSEQSISKYSGDFGSSTKISSFQMVYALGASRFDRSLKFRKGYVIHLGEHIAYYSSNKNDMFMIGKIPKVNSPTIVSNNGLYNISTDEIWRLE